jgi:hypothetical protein
MVPFNSGALADFPGGVLAHRAFPHARATKPATNLLRARYKLTGPGSRTARLRGRAPGPHRVAPKMAWQCLEWKVSHRP